MKLSWKLFFITTPVFALFLTVFGSWIVGSSFRTSLNKEIERSKVENQMFQNSYELVWNGLSEQQQEQITAKKLVESFYRRSTDQRGCARIYDGDGTVLYQENGLQVEHEIIEQLREGQNTGYEIVSQEERTYLVVASLSSLGLVMENIREITEIFGERTQMYAVYRVGVLVLIVVVGAVTLLVLFVVMGNMQKLSRATRRFASGNYDTRVKIRSQDEIGELAEDFNWMAGAMSTQMEQLQSEVRRQEEFTAAFAHELKTPLTSIIGYADTMRQMDLSEEERDMCADYIYRQGKRLQSLSYKLLEMTMAGKQEIQRRDILVPDFLREVAQTVEPSLQEKNIRLHVDAEEGYIYGDRELLGSLFINLIDNARKASRPGKNIWMQGIQIPGGYMISLQDEGGGIPREELHRVTEAFYMVDKSRARKEGGAGLGLALCQKIVELHQGSWQLENVETVRLPGGAENGQDSQAPGDAQITGLRITVRFGLPQATGRKRVRRRRNSPGEKQRSR